MNSLNRFAELVKEGRSVQEISRETALEVESIGRYLRWAKQDELIPQEVYSQGGYFMLEGDRYGKEAIKQKGMTTAVIFNDLHCPFQDDRSIELLCKVIEDVGPDILYENGDGLDCYTFSKFSRDPARAKSFQQEREIHWRCMKEIQSASTAEYHYMMAEDNHYSRFLRNVLWEHDLGDMPELSPHTVLHIKKEFLHTEPLFIGGTFRLAHGNRFGMYAAKATLFDYMSSGMMGHTHRMGSFFHSTPEKDYVYYMNGHLSNAGVTYGYRHDWQQGFSVVYFLPDGNFSVQQIPIVNHKAIFNGVLYQT